MAQQPSQGGKPEFQIAFVDLPDVSETFADSIEKITFENGLWRFEFCVTRLSDPKPTGIIQGKKHPSCRLVLTANAGIDLANKMRGILEIMEKQGMLKTIQPSSIVQPPQGGKPS